MLVDSLRGAVGLLEVKPRDAVRDAELFVREAVTCVDVPPGYKGGDLLRDEGPGRGVRGTQPCGSVPRSLQVQGLPARGAHRPRERVQLARGTLSRDPGGSVARVPVKFRE